MAKFWVHETMLCYVTFKFEVEAKDGDEALDKFFDGEATEIGHDVGDQSNLEEAQRLVYAT